MEEFAEAPRHYNILISVAMMFLFAAYLGMQSFLTSTLEDNEQDAFNCLTIVFAFFGLGNFAAAACIDFLGMWLSLVLGSWAHVILIAFAAIAVTDNSFVWLLYPGGFICGVGAGCLLWAGHGAYVARLVKPEKLGDAFGVFWSIFGFNEVLVFPIILLMNLVIGYDPKMFFWLLVVFGSIGSTLMMQVKEWPPKKRAQKGEEKPEQEPRAVSAETHSKTENKQPTMSKQELVMATLNMFFDRRALCIFPMCLLSGIMEGFYFTILPTFMDPKIMIPVGMTSHGLAVMLVGKVIGRMADRQGAVPVISAMMIPCIGGAVCAMAIIEGDGIDGRVNNGLFILAMSLGFGIIDFPMQGLIRMMITKIYQKEGKVEVGMAWMLISVACGLTWCTITATQIPKVFHPCLIAALAVLVTVGIRLLPKEVTVGTKDSDKFGSPADSAGSKGDDVKDSKPQPPEKTKKGQVMPAPDVKPDRPVKLPTLAGQPRLK